MYVSMLINQPIKLLADQKPHLNQESDLVKNDYLAHLYFQWIIKSSYHCENTSLWLVDLVGSVIRLVVLAVHSNLFILHNITREVLYSISVLGWDKKLKFLLEIQVILSKYFY